MSTSRDTSIDLNQPVRRNSIDSINSIGSTSSNSELKSLEEGELIESTTLNQVKSSSNSGFKLGRNASRKSNASTKGSVTPPLAGTFLTRFISSFKPTSSSGSSSSSSSNQSRPALSRSLSTPTGPTISKQKSPIKTNSNLIPSGLNNQNASASSSTTSLSRFRPSFTRRATTATTADGNYKNSDDISPLTSPLTLDTGDKFINLENIESGNNPEFKDQDQFKTDLSFDRGSNYTERNHRGSVGSQNTMQPLDSYTPSSQGAPSPLGRSEGTTTFSTTPHSFPHPHHLPIENPLSLIATLLPPALLLLSHLGPSHLFSPSLTTATLSPLLAPLLSSFPNHLSSDKDSIISSTASTSSSIPPGILRLNPSPAYTHELHAPSTISVPAVSAAAIWRLFRGFEWIGEVGKNGFKSVLLDTDDDDKVFDFPAVLQGVADVLAADAASRGVELVIGPCESSGSMSPVKTTPSGEFPPKEVEREIVTKELLVRADERGWGVVLIWIIHHILSGASAGSMVEVRFCASPAIQPTSTSPEPYTGSSGTALPTRNALEKWWNVELEILHSFNPSRSPYDKGTPPPTPLSPPFHTPFARSLFSYLDIVLVNGPTIDGTQSWKLEASLPAPRASIRNEDEPSTLLNRRRASLGSPGHEPSLEDLQKFSDTILKGTRVALHSGEQSTFAKYLTTCLAGWGMDVHHVALDSEDDNVSASVSDNNVPILDWSKTTRQPQPNRFDSGFASSFSDGNVASPTSDPGINSSSTESNSPAGSSTGSELPTSLVIIDDDVATLRKMLLSFRAPPLHYAPTLMSKRPQLATRRTRSSPHVRQANSVLNSTPGLVIVHFASLTHYKLIKEIVQDALATSRSAALPDVLVIPKPAGPRRILTALWTAMKRPPVDPSLSPIATSPTSPGIQYWTPRLSPALASGQDFDSAAAEVLAAKGDQSSTGNVKVRTPPVYFTGTPVGHPPSPLSQMDDQVSYFSCVAEEMDSTTASEGMVIQSPNGRPAIFFQPQSRGTRSTANSKEKEKSIEGGIESSNVRGHVAAPYEIGLGQPRRATSHSSNSSTDSPPVPIGTPALTLDSFILAAKSKINSPESTSPSDIKFPNEGNFMPRRNSSIISLGTRSPRSVATPPYPPTISRGVSGGSNGGGAISPPISPRPMSPSPAVNPATSPGVSFRDAPALNSSLSFRRISSPTSGDRPRKNTLRKSHLPTVPPINVLIVEDNPINQTILSMFMKKKGIKYSVAKDGEEAVQKWKAGDFHLVLMDIQLPVKDGIEATREIREMERANNIGTFITTPNSDSTSPTSTKSPTSSSGNSSNTPTSPLLSMPVIIVALTASSLQIDRVTALAAGCNDFLTKPVSLPWLQQKLLEWGSMAYLSGFSRRDVSSSERSSTTNFSTRLGSSTMKQAESISAHLHIDHKSLNSKIPPSITSSPASLLKPKLPGLAIIPATPTPKLDDQSTVQPTNLVEPVSEAVMNDGVNELSLDDVDHKLRDLAIASANTNIRPGPTPLAIHREPVVAQNESSILLENVLKEGSRLVSVGRSRGDSFSLVMQNSEPNSQQHSPELP